MNILSFNSITVNSNTDDVKLISFLMGSVLAVPFAISHYLRGFTRNSGENGWPLASALSNPCGKKAVATIALVSIPRPILERLGLAVDGRAAEIAAAILSSGFLLARERNRDFAVNRHSAHTCRRNRAVARQL